MISIPGLLLLILIAAVCGAVGSAIAGGSRGGLLVSIVLGFIGALLGSWIARQMILPEPFVLHAAGQAFPILWSIVGPTAVFALGVYQDLGLRVAGLIALLATIGSSSVAAAAVQRNQRA